MKSHGHFRAITIAMSLLAASAFSLAWQAQDVSAAAERAPALRLLALQGKAAVEHLKQQGLYSSLRTALSATLTTDFTQLTEIAASDSEVGQPAVA